MAWTYEQRTGRLRDNLGNLVGVGYAGGNCCQQSEGKNNPDMDHVAYVGPLPRGRYTIGPPRDTVTHGPYVLPLTPHADNAMHGRSAFLIHGDSVVRPGCASDGCIIQARDVRYIVGHSLDHELDVVADYTAPDAPIVA